jgi:hypothetical protein
MTESQGTLLLENTTEIIKLSTASILLIMTFRYILNIVMLLITKFVGVAK